MRADDGAAPLVIGRPLSSACGTDETEQLHAADATTRRRLLHSARGTFCLVRHTRGDAVELAADKLAALPLLYGHHEGVWYASNSLRALVAACPPLAQHGDLAGQAQLAALGFNLGERTAYARVRCVAAGAIVRLGPDGSLSRSSYHDWRDDAPAAPASLAQLHRAFIDGVRLRLSQPTPAALAYLSGGLDSRCVVAALADCGRIVHSVNFAPAGSADLVLARAVAQAFSASHFEADCAGDFWQRSVDAYRQLADRIDAAHRPSPPAIWTGFGGESVLAPTNLTEPMVRALRGGRRDAALQAYFERVGGGLPLRAFRPEHRPALVQALRDSLYEALDACAGDDPALAFHRYLMTNEIRGNLQPHFEHFAQRALDFELPFLDAEFVRLALSLPVDGLLGHRAYYDWLACFAAPVAQLPWQAYPWSLPCPHPMPEGLRSQWGQGEGWLDAAGAREEKRRLLDDVAAALARSDFPGRLIDRTNIRAAYWLARLGIDRYAYLLQTARRLTPVAARDCVAGAAQGASA